MASPFRCIALVALIGCSSADDEGSSGEPSRCAPGEQSGVDGQCVRAGLPADLPCPPGEWLRDGVCVPAGVPPDGCGTGFAHDGDRGCEPIFPSDACGDGQMAVPGETRCRAIDSCASGVWGGIATEPDTEYVDASYTGGASDGTQTAPWTRIQDAVDAAPPGAIVAIAAGNYLESVNVQGKAVRLWGKCPSLVTIEGTVGELATLFIRGGAGGSRVRGLAITGPTIGVFVSGSEDIVAERMWIHDNAGHGIQLQDDLGATALIVKDALVERNREVGVFVASAAATVEATVIRDTTLDGVGRGISLEVGPVTGAPASVLVQRSVIDRNRGTGLIAVGSEAIVEDTVIRGMKADAGGLSGRGVGVQRGPTADPRARAILRRSLLSDNREFGLYVSGADAVVEATVLRDTLPDAQGDAGSGVNVQDSDDGTRSTIDMKYSLVERHHQIGVYVRASDATLEATVVRDTFLDARGIGARGIAIQDNPAMGGAGTLDLKSSLIERNHEVGLLVTGSSATVETTVVRDTALDAETASSRAIQVQRGADTGAPASASFHACVVERAFQAGIFIAGPADAQIEACELRTTMMQSTVLGDGIVVWSVEGLATASVLSTLIEESERAGLSSFGGNVTIGSSLLICQGIDVAAEPWEGRPSVFDDRGGVSCGCPEATNRCVAQSYALAPPPAIGGLD